MGKEGKKRKKFANLGLITTKILRGKEKIG